MINVPAMRPAFIVFEGLDGSGKSSCARLAAEALGAVSMTTPSRRVRAYRDDLLTSFGGSQEAAQLFYLATVFAASKEIRSHRAAGTPVVLDRYFLSTQCYAEFRGSSLRVDALEMQLEPADVTVYLDAPLDVRTSRLTQRGMSVADRETMGFEADRRLRELHLCRATLPVAGRFLVIDSSRCTPGEVVERVLRTLDVGSPGRAGQ